MEAWKSYLLWKSSKPMLPGNPFEPAVRETTIRIISLQPGDDGSTIKCEFHALNIGAPVVPKYEALSYRLREPKANEDIWIDGHETAVCSNLYQALNAIRFPDKTRTLWIDSLCCEHALLKTDTEKAARMREIHKKASQVLVWMNGDLVALGHGKVAETLPQETTSTIPWPFNKHRSSDSRRIGRCQDDFDRVEYVRRELLDRRPQESWDGEVVHRAHDLRESLVFSDAAGRSRAAINPPRSPDLWTSRHNVRDMHFPDQPLRHSRHRRSSIRSGPDSCVNKLGSLFKYPLDLHRHINANGDCRGHRHLSHGNGLAKCFAIVCSVPQILTVRNYAIAQHLVPPSLDLAYQRYPSVGRILSAIMPEYASRAQDMLNALPWVLTPSPQLFLLCILGSTACLRLYAYLSRPDQYQVWFVLLGLLSWPLSGVVLGMDLLATSLSILPWTVLFSLLLSDVVHAGLYMLARRHEIREHGSAYGFAVLEENGLIHDSEADLGLARKCEVF